ncbi:MAG: histidine kinase dimerization/phospho-acceptor domain-containing protein [Terriglobia bacterium]
MKPPGKATENGIGRVLVLSQMEEAERLRDSWATQAPDFHLRTVPGVAEALQELAAMPFDVVVCDLTGLPAGAAATLLNSATTVQRVPVMALLSPGMEERAAALLTQGLAACVMKVGNYDLLLAATLGRLIGKRTPELQAAVALPGPQASSVLDFEELGMILRHEINNPLTGILGNAELVLSAEPPLAAEARRRVETIVDLAVRLRDLVRNLEQMLSEQSNQASLRRSSATLVLERQAERASPSKPLR